MHPLMPLYPDTQLTKRSKEKEVPMCGIPTHAVETYIERLVKKNVMVALCEQTEPAAEAKKRRSTVKREVTRLQVSL